MFCSGYVTLISLLVVGAVGVAIALSVILLGIGSSRTAFAIEQSDTAQGFANACAEEGLQQIRDAIAFTGSGNLTFSRGTCTYTVASQGGQNRTVITSGTVGTVVRRVSISITHITPVITISSWQEVDAP
jgi:hypothetical protein